MASSGGLTQIFKKPLPDNPTLIEYLSPAFQIRPPPPLPVTPALEFLGELSFFTKKTDPHFDSPFPSPRPPTPSTSSDQSLTDTEGKGCIADQRAQVRNVKNLQKLRSFESLCTEGLGFESSGNLHEDAVISNGDGDSRNKGRYVRSRSDVSSRNHGGFPPPISCITKSGKPSIFLRPYRKDGMLVLKEFRIARELHSTREDGRLRMHFTHPDQEGYDRGEDGVEQEERQELGNEKSEKGEQDQQKKGTGNGDGDSQHHNVTDFVAQEQ